MEDIEPTEAEREQMRRINAFRRVSTVGEPFSSKTVNPEERANRKENDGGKNNEFQDSLERS